jgi:hypothetical protein
MKKSHKHVMRGVDRCRHLAVCLPCSRRECAQIASTCVPFPEAAISVTDTGSAATPVHEFK